MSQTKKTVKITENELINVIAKIVDETVVKEKKKWITEQAAKKVSVLETKVTELEKKLKQLTEGKK